ncbi:putative leader peptide [Streptomyces sp. NPDC088156]|uniref:putative leader peptide n=1 Tax=Streptomyces sp. NPDC088156 TaxID=3365831 RepID=UPI0038010007
MTGRPHPAYARTTAGRSSCRRPVGRRAGSRSVVVGRPATHVNRPTDRQAHWLSRCGPHGDSELTGVHRHGVLRTVTDTDVRLWRRVHMDLVRYAGCVCRPSC